MLDCGMLVSEIDVVGITFNLLVYRINSVQLKGEQQNRVYAGWYKPWWVLAIQQ